MFERRLALCPGYPGRMRSLLASLNVGAALLSLSVAHADKFNPVTTLPAEGSVQISAKAITLKFEPAVKGASENQAKKLEAARALAEKALNDPAVRSKIVYFSSVEFGGKPNAGYFQASRRQGRKDIAVISNTEILDALLASAAPDGAINLVVVIDVRERETTVGNFAKTPLATPDGITTINPTWLNRDSTSIADVADNLIHEHMHRIGFEHFGSRSNPRCASAPYVVGHLVCVFGSSEKCFPNRDSRC